MTKYSSLPKKLGKISPKNHQNSPKNAIFSLVSPFWAIWRGYFFSFQNMSTPIPLPWKLGGKFPPKLSKFPSKITKIPQKMQFSAFSTLSWPYQGGNFFFFPKYINFHPPSLKNRWKIPPKIVKNSPKNHKNSPQNAIFQFFSIFRQTSVVFILQGPSHQLFRT